MIKQKEVEKMAGESLFEINDSNNRRKIAIKLSEIYVAEFKDKTTPEDIGYNLAVFGGLNPITGKYVTITIGMSENEEMSMNQNVKTGLF